MRHNPSYTAYGITGDPAPSAAADVQITPALREAAKIIDIELLDHVIVPPAALPERLTVVRGRTGPDQNVPLRPRLQAAE